MFAFGGAGEFYRNYLKSREYFALKYLTPEETISKYTFYEYDKERYIDMLYHRYGQKNTFEKFELTTQRKTPPNPMQLKIKVDDLKLKDEEGTDELSDSKENIAE